MLVIQIMAAEAVVDIMAVGPVFMEEVVVVVVILLV